MPTERFTFEGPEGQELAALLDRPAGGAAHAWALFAHCFTCSKNSRAAVDVSRALAAEGVAVLRFDFTGLGESEGEFSDTSFSSNVEDLVAAGRFMAERLEAPRLLVGHSLGGAAAIHAAHGLDSVRAVATLGAPADPSHVLRHVQDSRDEIEETGRARLILGGRSFHVGAGFLRDVEATRMEEAVAGLERALLIMHAPLDAVVGIENAARLFELARHPRSFLSLDDADHLLTRQVDSGWVARVLAAWASRYVGRPSAEGSEEEVTKGERVVVRTGADGFRTEIRARRHALIADEPESVGGEDEGPTPYDLVAAGLGACTSMTLRMYADRKGWPLEEAVVRLRHTKLHKRDEEVCEEGGDARLDRIDREIELGGPLDEEQRARLIEIAERCPVHRTLEAGVRIETTAKEE